MYHGIEQRDDVPVHFHGVGHQHVVLVNPQDALGDAGLAVAGAAVEEQRLVADERGPQLVEQFVGQHQVAKGLAQAVAAQPHLGGLGLHHLVILQEGYGRRARILADFVPRGRQRAAGAAERERVIVAPHALDLQQLLLAELVEKGFQNGERDFERRREGSGASRRRAATGSAGPSPSPSPAECPGLPGGPGLSATLRAELESEWRG